MNPATPRPVEAAAWLAAGALVACALARGGASPSPGAYAAGRAALWRGDAASALTAAQTLLAAYPDEPEYLRLEADALGASGRFREQARSLERFLARSSHPMEACRALPDVYRKAGDAAAALDALRRCRALDPGDPEQTFRLAQALESADRHEEAAEAYAAVLKSDPGLLGAALSLARVRLKQGRLSEAESLVEGVLRLRPGNAAALMLGSMVAEAQGRPAAAEARLAAAVAADPRHPELRSRLEELRRRRGR